MGFPSPAADYAESRLSIDELCTTNAAHVYLMRAASRSVREGIRSNALLVVDRTGQMCDGSILVMVREGEFHLKRLRIGNTRRLEALDNPQDSIEITEEMVLDRTEDASICFGVVTHVLNTLRVME